MEFIDKIREKIESLWAESFETSFIKELQTGELSDERFQRYMEQDTVYLLYYMKLCAKAITNAETEEEMWVYASMIAYANEIEMAAREEKKKLVRETKLLSATKRYVNFLMEVYEDSNNDRIFLVLVNCMLSYDYLFSKLVKEMKKEDKYWFFVKDYASDDYRDFCDRWLTFMNQKYRDISEEEMEKALAILKTSCSMEYDFWEMAYYGK